MRSSFILITWPLRCNVMGCLCYTYMHIYKHVHTHIYLYIIYIYITRLPSKQQLRWLRKPLVYRESSCTNLSVSCPYEKIVYSVLKHINTTRVHTISRQFIPLINLMVLWEKEFFLTFDLLCPFTNVRSCPLVRLPVLINF